MDKLTEKIYQELCEAYDKFLPDNDFIRILDKYPDWDINTTMPHQNHFMAWRQNKSSELYIYYFKRGGGLSVPIIERKTVGNITKDRKTNHSIIHSLTDFLTYQNIQAFYYLLDNYSCDIENLLEQDKDNQNKPYSMFSSIISNTESIVAPIFKKIFERIPNCLANYTFKRDFLNECYASESIYRDLYLLESEIKNKVNRSNLWITDQFNTLSLFIQNGYLPVGPFLTHKMLPFFIDLDTTEKSYCKTLLLLIKQWHGFEASKNFFLSLLEVPYSTKTFHSISKKEIDAARLMIIKDCFSVFNMAEQKSLCEPIFSKEYKQNNYICWDNFFLDIERTYNLETSFTREYDWMGSKTILLPPSVAKLCRQYPQHIPELSKLEVQLHNLSYNNLAHLHKSLTHFFDFIQKSIRKVEKLPHFSLLQDLLTSLEALKNQQDFSRLIPIVPENAGEFSDNILISTAENVRQVEKQKRPISKI